jgi:hypothetical protein
VELFSSYFQREKASMLKADAADNYRLREAQEKIKHQKDQYPEKFQLDVQPWKPK